jgi:threonine/homoserine/homoserine lactone efflux protein
MFLPLFIKGFVSGLIIALPIGPVGALCFHRLLINGKKSGVISGLGGALADAMFGLIGFYGLNYISKFLISNQSFFRLFIGFLLIFLGIRTLYYKKPGKNIISNNASLLADFISTFSLTITNPFLIIIFVEMFHRMKIKYLPHDPNEGIALFLGIFVGSAIWWIVLAILMKIFRIKIDSSFEKYINRFFGILIIIFGIAFLFFKKVYLMK